NELLAGQVNYYTTLLLVNNLTETTLQEYQKKLDEVSAKLDSIVNNDIPELTNKLDTITENI
ncbi:MAG: hypothetical protein IJT56_00750, partial [Clostridia bacterium]|nr:hypothetical protein [Clostridia bacterium]